VKLLLDTHVWIWSQSMQARIGTALAKIIREPATQLWLSPISVWELLVLTEKGRLLLDRDLSGWVRNSVSEASIQEAPLTHEIALESRTVRLSHADPADRLLVATARVLDLTLATADRHLLRSGACKTVANR
jgi:PIN domain nuclease of toxin-antitoxin system